MLSVKPKQAKSPLPWTAKASNTQHNAESRVSDPSIHAPACTWSPCDHAFFNRDTDTLRGSAEPTSISASRAANRGIRCCTCSSERNPTALVAQLLQALVGSMTSARRSHSSKHTVVICRHNPLPNLTKNPHPARRPARKRVHPHRFMPPKHTFRAWLQINSHG